MAEETFDSDAKVYGEIYVIENDVNDKLYVGQTIRPFNERFKEHCYADFAIGKAIRKYGAEHFRIRSLEKCYSREHLNEREIFWIAKLNSKAPHGYNLNEGGKGGLNPSEEIRAKNSATHKGRKFSAETRAKISATLISYYREHPEAAEHLSIIGKGSKNAVGHKVSKEKRDQESPRLKKILHLKRAKNFLSRTKVSCHPKRESPVKSTLLKYERKCRHHKKHAGLKNVASATIKLYFKPVCSRRASTLSRRSHGNSTSVLPKCPYAEVFL